MPVFGHDFLGRAVEPLIEKVEVLEERLKLRLRGMAGEFGREQLQFLPQLDLAAEAFERLDEEALDMMRLQALGLGAETGTLEVGKLADLQVLDRNPLVDIKNTNSVRFVMKNGRLYDGNTLDEVWPRAKALPPQWWWAEDPAVKR